MNENNMFVKKHIVFGFFKNLLYNMYIYFTGGDFYD